MYEILTTRRLGGALLAGTLSAAGVLAQPAPEPTAPATPSAAAHSGRTVVSPGNAQWAADVKDARARASRENKLVYYEFARENCGDCRRMEAELYPAFDFEALLVGMVPVQILIGSPEGKELAKTYRIQETPSVLITTPEGRLVFLMQSFKDVGDFYRHVHKDLDAYREFARKIDAQDVGSLSAGEAYATGRELYLRLDYAAARPRLKRASVAPGGGANLKDTSLELLADCELELGKPADARKTIDALIATTRNPKLRERAELFRAQIPLSQNNPAEALTLYKKFEKDHPQSPYIEQVRAYIARLEPPKSTP